MFTKINPIGEGVVIRSLCAQWKENHVAASPTTPARKRNHSALGPAGWSLPNSILLGNPPSPDAGRRQGSWHGSGQLSAAKGNDGAAEPSRPSKRRKPWCGDSSPQPGPLATPRNVFLRGQEVLSEPGNPALHCEHVHLYVHSSIPLFLLIDTTLQLQCWKQFSPPPT